MPTTNPCILVIDDDESIRDFISLALTDEGYTVVTASDGGVALEMVTKYSPMLILLDMRMPNVDGATFVHAYRSLPMSRAPVIVLTAARNASEFATQVNADAFLAKPFNLDELLALVQKHLQDR
jgi:DNA-binding response OmpR family regulator